MNRSFFCVLFNLIFFTAFAQDDSQEPVENNASWIDTEQIITVNQTVTDQAIANRFEKILKVSQRVNDAQVKVTEGILVLEGWTADPEDKAWVEAAANRTEGVIAVVNNIEIRLIDQWDLQPAVNEAVSLYDRFIRGLPTLTIALLVLLLTWVAARVTSKIATRVLQNKVNNLFVLRMSSRLLAIPVVVVGIYLVLQLTGLTNLAITVVGGTGLLGLVIGIAFKDIAENFLASILISIQRPFKIGDYILVNGQEGVVQSVTTRGTVIMSLEGNHIHVPNAIIYKNTIVNVTANPNIRKDFTVGIGYDDSIIEAQQIALDVLLKHEAVLNDPEPQVLVDNLGAATVNLVIYFWVDGQKNSVTKVKSALIRLIKRAYDQAQISMPDEAREVVFPEGVRVFHGQQKTESEKTVEKTKEPVNNSVEQDLSNEVEEIRKQSAENQLNDSRDNLIE